MCNDFAYTQIAGKSVLFYETIRRQAVYVLYRTLSIIFRLFSKYDKTENEIHLRIARILFFFRRLRLLIDANLLIKFFPSLAILLNSYYASIYQTNKQYAKKFTTAIASH